MPTSNAIRDYASDLRPDSWGDVCGQQSIVACLKAYCVSGKPPKGIVFVGDYGTGKSSLARLAAKSMACSGRKDVDPDPCGRCDSCLGFAGSFASLDTMMIGPQVPTADFKAAVKSVKNYSTVSIFSEAHRPMPVYMDDLDEHPRDHQQFLKREMDGYLCGFILAATTKPEKVEPGLLDRFQMMHLQPTEMPDLVPWIRGIAKKVGIGVISKDAAAAIARLAGMNHREILKLLQRTKDSGLGFSVADIEKAALMSGM